MGLSVLLHLLVLWLAYRFPSTVRRPEEVMEIDLSDIPRATDFLPAERGILEGRPPRPAPPPPARKEAPVPPAMQGRVPDLPVKPDLPPEESFPVDARKAEPAGEAKGPQGKEPAGARQRRSRRLPPRRRGAPPEKAAHREAPRRSRCGTSRLPSAGW